MQYKATSVDGYINHLPDDRKEAIKTLRNVLLDNLPKGFEEGLSYGMIGYFVPLSKYPKGYHCNPKLPLPFLNLASQKNSINLYHSGIYAKKELADWFINEYPKHCNRKLDMGKSCIRFKNIKTIPFKLIGELAKKLTVDQWIEIYENSLRK